MYGKHGITLCACEKGVWLLNGELAEWKGPNPKHYFNKLYFNMQMKQYNSYRDGLMNQLHALPREETV